MNVFLSSTVQDLADARRFLLEQIGLALGDRATMLSYETHGALHPGLTPEETCLLLVRQSQVIIVLLDRYYGAPSVRMPGISVTHAEVREAMERALLVIPVVRTQTWAELSIWEKNQKASIEYGHVKDAQLFELLAELYPKHNCQIYDTFTSNEALSKIVATLRAIVVEGAPGAADHVALVGAAPPIPANGTTVRRRGHFGERQVVGADDLNALYKRLCEIARKYGINMMPGVTWMNGTVLTANDLNRLLNDIATVYSRLNQPIVPWSFGVFVSGHILHASYLNEIVDRIDALERI